MGTVTNLASRRAPQSPKHQRTFPAGAGDYFAMEAARAYLVTRLMTTEQKTRYLDHIHKHFTDLGLELTNPEERRAAA